MLVTKRSPQSEVAGDGTVGAATQKSFPPTEVLPFRSQLSYLLLHLPIKQALAALFFGLPKHSALRSVS